MDNKKPKDNSNSYHNRLDFISEQNGYGNYKSIEKEWENVNKSNN